MPANPLLSQILADEALTRHLGDAEARVLVEWLVDQAEHLADTVSQQEAMREVGRLCRRARALARFVSLWCQERDRGAAGQLAATERFHWPLPEARVDPCELMQVIVACETTQLMHQRQSAKA